jgi:GH24 family phage-related lysozyme (muramidase)
MSVLIGHASLDENGTTTGGQPGDQNGKELCIRQWYSKPWKVVLRPKEKYAGKIASAMEAACANPNIGYSQPRRNTLHAEAKKTGYDLAAVKTPCETDCSALVTVCAIAAGIKKLEYTGNAPTTATMRVDFMRSGAFDTLTDSRYLTTDVYLKRGDILLAPGKHTAVVLSDGAQTTKKSAEEIAAEVLAGQWGNGEARKRALENAGYDYTAIQKIVNGTTGREQAEKTVKHISQRGIDFIKNYEKCRLKAYRLGNEKNYTIGWGHSGPDVLPNMTISQERADELFRIDLQEFEKYVRCYATIPLTQGRMDALTSYTYNRGPKGMQELAKVSKSPKEYADNMVLLWGSNQEYKQALIERRKAERELFLSD